ncbi:signal peptide containing protein [Theileria equi strain WA]|uniref:Signal peptide containing protein n=1 Tax=Theileria equi strain WA TaxID=1537102 RepID=L1LAI9_THEEQ|nr:signal peptide containing protein [Theileria equi strain WA]EKX72183.1 signal peptide containing protein [Theileria equi strain WA]|eukprot:XP_004831635.1 signal peptide containing protein [Theileria equi strain WA]
MKVSSVILATCLLGLCHCKRSRALTDRPVIEVLDDYADDELINYRPVRKTRKSKSSGQRLVWDLADGTAYEEEYIQSFARRCNAGKALEEESMVKCRHRYATPITLDIAHPNVLLCQSFDYYYDDNLTKLIVPEEGIIISKLMNGKEEVWSPSSGEEFDHAKVYFNKYNEPELVRVLAKTLTTVKEYYFELNNGVWVPSSNSEERMQNLRMISTCTSDLTVDISSTNSTDKCTVFQVNLLGVTTKHFFPNPGYAVVGVKDKSKELWMSPRLIKGLKPLVNDGTFDGYIDYCLSCVLYKKEDVKLLEMTVIENLSKRWKFFEKIDGEWNEVGIDARKTYIPSPFQDRWATLFDAKYFIKENVNFTVATDMEDTVPVLKCTAGNGASKLTYGSDTIWPGKKDVMCLSAVLYMDGDQPTLAVLVTRDNKNNKKSKVYRYHDGKQWKNGKEGTHKKKFEELKKKYNPE